MRNLLENLESAISSRSSQERVTLLRSVTDLFLFEGPNLTAHKLETFDRILCQLIEDIETRALAELSGQIAPAAMPPVQVVRQLARHEDIEVSGPVLAESTGLATDDLVEIASTRSQAHLAAIASRKVVEESVSDILVDRGDTRVARIVAGNAGARFSDGGYGKLVKRAESEEGVAEAVAGRADLSPELLRELVAKATDEVRQRLLAVSAPEIRAKVEQALTDVAAQIDQERFMRPRDYAMAQRFVMSIKHDQGLMRVSLRDVAQAGKLEYTVALLSAMSSMPIPAIERVVLRAHVGGVLLLCKAIDVDWTVTSAVLSLRHHDGGALASSESLFDQFRKLTVQTAQRVVRFWQVRESVGAAAR